MATQGSRASPPAADLVRLAYVSAATGPLDADDLERIAAAARRANAARGLTGLLLFGGTRFYGVLEGPRRRVLARMERIITDPRHCNVHILSEQDVAARRFANWTFGHLPAGGSQDPTALERFLVGLASRR